MFLLTATVSREEAALLQSKLAAERGLLLNTEQLVCPQQCNRIWERPAGHYHRRSFWPTKSPEAPSPTAVTAKQLLGVHSKTQPGSALPFIMYSCLKQRAPGVVRIIITTCSRQP